MANIWLPGQIIIEHATEANVDISILDSTSIRDKTLKNTMVTKEKCSIYKRYQKIIKKKDHSAYLANYVPNPPGGILLTWTNFNPSVDK